MFSSEYMGNCSAVVVTAVLRAYSMILGCAVNSSPGAELSLILGWVRLTPALNGFLPAMAFLEIRARNVRGLVLWSLMQVEFWTRFNFICALRWLCSWRNRGNIISNSPLYEMILPRRHFRYKPQNKAHLLILLCKKPIISTITRTEHLNLARLLFKIFSFL